MRWTSLARTIYGLPGPLDSWWDGFCCWLAWRLPRTLVKWAYIRVAAHATTGKHENTVVPELSMMDALRRWD